MLQHFRYIVTVLMMWHLSKKTTLQLPKLKNLQFGGYLKSGDCLFTKSMFVVWISLLVSWQSFHNGTVSSSICLCYSGGFLMGRTISVATTVTLSTSMVARLGALSVAAHQICLQVWLSAALLVEAQAACSQVIIQFYYISAYKFLDII